MEKDFKFSFIERPISCLSKGYLEFYAFQRGKILPAALIELTPCKVRVSNFRLDDADNQKMKEEFRQFSGCEI